MSVEQLTFRRATRADASRLAEVLAEGFETYRSFAPDTFTPPAVALEVERIEERLGQPEAWVEIAEDGAAPAGHVGFLPAAIARRAVADPRLFHFWQLFVRPAWWGTGLATRLHGDAIAEAARRGFTTGRLFTPAGQTRARRFYEREGWQLAGEPEFDESLGLEIVEYRLTLRS